MNATDPIVAGINYHHDHKTAEGATSNPATVQAHIDRSLAETPAEVHPTSALKFWQTVNLFDHTF